MLGRQDRAGRPSLLEKLGCFTPPPLGFYDTHDLGRTGRLNVNLVCLEGALGRPSGEKKLSTVTRPQIFFEKCGVESDVSVLSPDEIDLM